MNPQYEMFIELVHRRMSVRKLKQDPLPEGAIEKILEAGRWAMSGANGQPWEYIIVTDPAVKQKLFKLYVFVWQLITQFCKYQAFKSFYILINS